MDTRNEKNLKAQTQGKFEYKVKRKKAGTEYLLLNNTGRARDLGSFVIVFYTAR